MATLEERIAKLERGNRRLRIVLILLVLGGLCALCLLASKPVVAQAQEAPKEIRAERFVLEDENGKTHATLDVRMGGAKLTMYDGRGRPRVILETEGDGRGGLGMLDEKGRAQIGLQTGITGPGLNLWDKTGCRVTLGLSKDEPSLHLYDKKGKTRVRLCVDEDTPQVGLFVTDE